MSESLKKRRLAALEQQQKTASQPAGASKKQGKHSQPAGSAPAVASERAARYAEAPTTSGRTPHPQGRNTAATEEVYGVLQQLVLGMPKTPTNPGELQSLLEGKLRNKYILLDNPHASAPTAGGMRMAQQNLKGLASKLLSAKKRRAGGAHALPAEIPYESLAPLQKLWGEHAAAALSAKGAQSAEQKLAAIDFHGCLFEVISSTCSSRVHLCGVLAMETANAFSLVNPANRVLVVPKQGSRFAFSVGNERFVIDGDNMRPLAARRPPLKAKGGQQANAPRKVAT